MKYEVLKQAKLIQWFLLGRRAGAQQLTGKEQEGNFWSDDNVLYLNKNLNYTNVYIFQNSPNGTHKICAFHCITVLPKKCKRTINKY